MKIMILGSGAREYSIGATESLGTNLNLKDPVVLATYAKEKGFDLCIVGSESFLAEGVVDIFKQQGLAIFGPSKAAAMLETSKSFMKSFLKKYRIKTAKFLNTNDIEKAKNFIYSLTPPIVVKADGLCAGKGVIIAKTHEEAIEETAKMLSGESFGDAGKLVVIEEFLDGYELSIFAVLFYFLQHKITKNYSIMIKGQILVEWVLTLLALWRMKACLEKFKKILFYQL